MYLNILLILATKFSFVTTQYHPAPEGSPSACIKYDTGDCSYWKGGIACCMDATSEYRGYYLECTEKKKWDLKDCGPGKVCAYLNPNQCIRNEVFFLTSELLNIL